jgi:hypothetical protein
MHFNANIYQEPAFFLVLIFDTIPYLYGQSVL